MIDAQEVAQWFHRASARQDRKEVALLVMAGEDPLNVRSLNKNYAAWAWIIEGVSRGTFPTNFPPTTLRRILRGLNDLLLLGVDLPASIQANAARWVCEIQEVQGDLGDRRNFVYAFTTPAREGIRVGQTSTGWQRLNQHLNVYGSLEPVALVRPPSGSTPRELEKSILEDTRSLRDNRNQDWLLIPEEAFLRIALNHGARIVPRSEEIWKESRRGLASS